MSIHRIPEITAERENFRMEEFLPGVERIRRDPVEPVPVGTCIAMVFRVTGYDQDCDGSLMARVEHVDRHGDATGWEETRIGLYPDTDVVVDGPGALHELIEDSDGS